MDINRPSDFAYILGYGRSGSTLVESALQRHYACTGLGEVIFLWSRGVLGNEMCACRKPFGQCEFWQEVIRHGFGTVSEADAQHYARVFERGHLIRPSMDPFALTGDDRDQFRDIARALYGSLLTLSGGKRMLLDSSKQPVFGYWLARYAGFKVDFIHIFRDPRAVVASWLSNKTRLESGETGTQMTRSKLVAGPVWRWRYINWLSGRVPAMTGMRKHLVCYEDFCNAPEREMDRIADFLRIGPASEDPGAWHSVSGNPDRFTDSYDRIRLDERWRERLSPMRQNFVQAACGDAYDRLRNRARA